MITLNKILWTEWVLEINHKQTPNSTLFTQFKCVLDRLHTRQWMIIFYIMLFFLFLFWIKNWCCFAMKPHGWYFLHILIFQDIRPLKAGRCQYYSSGSGYIYENFYTSVSKTYKLRYTVKIYLYESNSDTLSQSELQLRQAWSGPAKFEFMSDITSFSLREINLWR